MKIPNNTMKAIKVDHYFKGSDVRDVNNLTAHFELVSAVAW